jgi:hypothetical protein
MLNLLNMEKQRAMKKKKGRNKESQCEQGKGKG